MLHTMDVQDARAPSLAEPAGDDYERVRTALAFITLRARQQPSLDEVAAHVGLSPSHFHALFKRWAGLTPKAFLQAVTLDRAKRSLGQEASLLDAALEVGLSGPSRLHDLFVTHEGMTPAQWRGGGAGLRMAYGFHPSPFGEALLVVTERGLAGLGWAEAGSPGDGKPGHGRAGALADMARRWPGASLVEDAAATAPVAARVFDPAAWQPDRPLRVVMIGGDFELRVWERLLAIPFGETTSYGSIAADIGRPTAARAVGAAVGRNPISFVVPCHRVVGRSGALTGYHWGVTRKQAILGWEAGAAGTA